MTHTLPVQYRNTVMLQNTLEQSPFHPNRFPACINLFLGQRPYQEITYSSGPLKPADKDTSLLQPLEEPIAPSLLVWVPLCCLLQKQVFICLFVCLFIGGSWCFFGVLFCFVLWLFILKHKSKCWKQDIHVSFFHASESRQCKTLPSSLICPFSNTCLLYLSLWFCKKKKKNL